MGTKESPLIENEIILLRHIYEHIGDLLNHSLMKVEGRDSSKYVMFHDMNQRRLFFILLVDFLSKTDKRGPITQVSFLGGLRDVCEKPQFSVSNSEHELNHAVTKLVSWLNETTKFDIWLQSITETIELKIKRIDYLKMCGDVSKHNYLRVISVVGTLQKILGNSGVTVTQEQAMLILPEFYERFSEDILIYLASHICEMLNDISWGIYKYLLPEFHNSHHSTNENLAGYAFHIPKPIKSEYARVCYWELMNGIIRKPYFERFKVSDDFKSHY